MISDIPVQPLRMNKELLVALLDLREKLENRAGRSLDSMVNSGKMKKRDRNRVATLQGNNFDWSAQTVNDQLFLIQNISDPYDILSLFSQGYITDHGVFHRAWTDVSMKLADAGVPELTRKAIATLTFALAEKNPFDPRGAQAVEWIERYVNDALAVAAREIALVLQKDPIIYAFLEGSGDDVFAYPDSFEIFGSNRAGEKFDPATVAMNPIVQALFKFRPDIFLSHFSLNEERRSTDFESLCVALDTLEAKREKRLILSIVNGPLDKTTKLLGNLLQNQYAPECVEYLSRIGEAFAKRLEGIITHDELFPEQPMPLLRDVAAYMHRYEEWKTQFGGFVEGLPVVDKDALFACAQQEKLTYQEEYELFGIRRFTPERIQEIIHDTSENILPTQVLNDLLSNNGTLPAETYAALLSPENKDWFIRQASLIGATYANVVNGIKVYVGIEGVPLPEPTPVILQSPNSPVFRLLGKDIFSGLGLFEVEGAAADDIAEKVLQYSRELLKGGNGKSAKRKKSQGAENQDLFFSPGVINDFVKAVQRGTIHPTDKVISVFAELNPRGLSVLPDISHMRVREVAH